MSSGDPGGNIPTDGSVGIGTGGTVAPAENPITGEVPAPDQVVGIFITPLNGDVVTGGRIPIRGQAHDVAGTKKMELRIDGVLKKTVRSGNFTYHVWDTRPYRGHAATLKLQVYDTDGPVESETITVTVT